jgi:hypothetical protein
MCCFSPKDLVSVLLLYACHYKPRLVYLQEKLFYPIFHCALYSRAHNIRDNSFSKQVNSSKKSTIYNLKSCFKSRAGYNGGVRYIFFPCFRPKKISTERFESIAVHDEHENLENSPKKKISFSDEDTICFLDDTQDGLQIEKYR